MNLTSTQSHLLPDLQMISDDLEEQQWHFTLHRAEEDRGFTAFQLYTAGQKPQKDVLYILGQTPGDFPIHEYCYIASGDIQGRAGHIRSVGKSTGEIVNALMNLFRRYWEFSDHLKDIIASGGDLNELCMAACEFFQNPVYVHDPSFTVLAMPRRVEGMLQMDYNPRTDRYYVPLWLVEDFKFNDTYQDTLLQHGASLWLTDFPPHNYRTLYVNLWEGDIYRGRLLINELQTALEKGSARAAEFVAGCVLRLMQRDELSSSRNYRSFEDTFKSLISGQEVDPTDMNALLTVLGWREEDRYFCCMIASQDEQSSISGAQTARNELTTILPNSFSFYMEQRLYMVVNLTASGLTAPLLSSRLAPVFRDSLLYGGGSFPVDGLHMLPAAFLQARYALRRAVRLRQSRWFMFFEDCVLEYTLEHAEREFTVQMLASPALQGLLRHDREKGTEYYATLRAYLRHERSIPRTSEALIIHRTTLEYRLEKIRQLVTLDLDDEQVRLYLLMSFYMLDAAGSAR